MTSVGITAALDEMFADVEPAVEKEFSQRMGRRVSIKNGAKKGKVELEYYDVDDLNDLLDQLEHVFPLNNPDQEGVEA